MRKSCSQCPAPAEYSLCFLLSSVGRSKRQQKCTASVPFCNACIQRLFAEIGTTAPSALIQPVRAAYTAIASHSETRREDTSPKEIP